jgi:hypothetical protein
MLPSLARLKPKAASNRHGGVNDGNLGRENRIEHANDDKLSGHVLGEVANGKNLNVHFTTLPTTSLSFRIPIISKGHMRSNCRRKRGCCLNLL